MRIGKERLRKVLAIIAEMFPEAKGELTWQPDRPYQLLIAVILSAQTTDKAVNKVTPVLWAKYPDLADLAAAELSDVETCLRTIGLYKNKAKNIIRTAQLLLEEFDGQVPKTYAQLESLPGVGRKTANVVLGEVYNIPGIAVDTHVARVAKRLNISAPDASVTQIETDLMAKIPKRDWVKTHHRLIFFGRYHCLAKNPKCQECPVQSYCHYYKQLQKKSLS
ncbi:endonuclease III [Streptococcus halichoeri]|uniref:endonuclease III n=1 Tax=Streptococcus halichoeri TaxID=254785 RepID=UPI0013569B38|nr:endonuclease III [Streptococcus halichoeri]